MGLATPAAIMAGSNAAAQRGILIRDGVALEKAGQVTAVLFDKTGTLTTGKPEVVKVWETGTSREIRRPSRNPTVRLAAALASHSPHPISQAVARLSSDGPALTDWQEVRGAGVQARVERRSPVQPRYRPARLLRWLEESGVDLAPGQGVHRRMDRARAPRSWDWRAESSLAAVCGEGRRQARRPRGHSGTRAAGAEDLPGHRRQRADGREHRRGRLASRRTMCLPRCAPSRRRSLCRKLQQQGQRVAFVGDGINDAPALEQADLGIAVSRASDVAREAADIILLKSEIEAVPESLGLARATLRTIKQNLFWAFFYNAIGVPLAALGFMSPILCAAAMGLSDLVVIGNALRLRRWRAP